MSTAGLRADAAAQAPGCHISKQRHATTIVVAVVFKETFKDHITFLNPRLHQCPGLPSMPLVPLTSLGGAPFLSAAYWRRPWG